MECIYTSRRSLFILSPLKRLFNQRETSVYWPYWAQNFSSYSKQSSGKLIVDLRSDTVTKPCASMISSALKAPLGDDVYGEDPTTSALEAYTAHLFQKETALFVPTGTMANLISIMAHCHERASEIIIGAESHICLWEGGGAANLAGVSARQVQENEGGIMSLDDIHHVYRRDDDDDHFAKTTLICLENTHNMTGGIALSKAYIDSVGKLAKQLGVQVHMDGARIFNAACALNVTVASLCESVDSISVCLSKGLGAPLGSLVVGNAEWIRRAKRARKRVGGGMRQAGVVASMGMYALLNNVQRLRDDHVRAKRVATELVNHGFYQPQQGNVDTNIVYFALPEHCSVSKQQFVERLAAEYGVRIGSGYSRDGQWFRIVTHLDVDDACIDRALEGIISIAFGSNRQ